MKRLVAFLVLALLAAGIVLALRSLPWWAIVGGVVLLVIIGKLLAGRLLRKMFLAPFRAKGAVLKGATASIHGISAGEPPTRKSQLQGVEPGVDGSAAEVATVDATVASTSAGPRLHYVLDVTITPGQSEGPFGHWAPGEVVLVRPESVLHPESDEPDDQDDACEVSGVQYEEGGAWKDDEGMKFAGPLRLKMYLAVKPEVRELKFRYYFEEFGLVQLP